MSKWRGKRVAVVGLGVSNMALIRYLIKQGAVISGRDRKTEVELGGLLPLLQELEIELVLGHNYLAKLDQYEAVFLTPGIPKHVFEIAEIKGKIPVYSEISLVLEQAQAPVLGITGSNGKTTTTTLVGEMLKQSDVPYHLGGNIGNPLIEEVDQIESNERIVLEMSSFQLEMLNQSPEIALVTNISENHLDIHLSMENYINAKKQIFVHQTPDDIAIFNYDDPIALKMAQEAIGKVYYFSTHQSVIPGAYLDGEQLIFHDQAGKTVVVSKNEVGLLGEHNLQNILAAIIMAHLAGAKMDAIRNVAREFTGVTHRLEKIATINQITYYNDSIATSPSRAIAGINAIKSPIILIAGGYDKHLSYTSLAAAICGKVKHLILLGQTAAQIQGAVERLDCDHVSIHRVFDLEQAVKLSTELAEPQDTILLSPASASYDMYPNFMARGEHFRKLVLEGK